MVVSELSFGCSSLGGVFRSVKEQEAIEAVFTAIECGINFLDVSPYYGHYKAETVLGKALKSIPRDKYYLSTKVGRYGKDGVNIWDYSAKRAKESVYESMERLNIDHIDLINVHDIEFQASLPGGLKKVAEETLPALHELKEEGVVGHIGITDLQPENLKWVIDNTESGLVESVLCFCHYCLNDTLILDYLDDFEQKGVGVINASPLSNTHMVLLGNDYISFDENGNIVLDFTDNPELAFQFYLKGLKMKNRIDLDSPFGLVIDMDIANTTPFSFTVEATMIDSLGVKVDEYRRPDRNTLSPRMRCLRSILLA